MVLDCSRWFFVVIDGTWCFYVVSVEFVVALCDLCWFLEVINAIGWF